MVDLRAPAPAKSVTRRPATPRPRSKLGDGTTTRCVHAARDELLVIVSEATLDRDSSLLRVPVAMRSLVRKSAVEFR
jgi:hypothetical protein